MRLARISPLLAAFLLAACGNTQRVEQPIGAVQSKLAAMPTDANAMQYVAEFPGADYFLENQGNRLIWHFRHNGKDFGRFVAELEPEGTTATDVTTSFENSDEAELAGKLGFLRDLARKAGDASVNAALTGKAVNREEFHQMFVAQVAANPMGAATSKMSGASAAMDKAMKEQEQDAYYRSSPLPQPGVLPEPGQMPMRGGEREKLRRDLHRPITGD